MGISPPQFGEDPAPPLLPELAPSRVPHTFRALRHRNFRLFIGGQIVSLVGTWMQNVAQSWLVYRLTHSELLLGTDPNDAASHPHPELLAGVNSVRGGNLVTATLSLLNTGFYDAYGVEAVMVAPDNSSAISTPTWSVR